MDLIWAKDDFTILERESHVFRIIHFSQIIVKGPMMYCLLQAFYIQDLEGFFSHLQIFWQQNKTFYTFTFLLYKANTYIPCGLISIFLWKLHFSTAQFDNLCLIINLGYRKFLETRVKTSICKYVWKLWLMLVNHLTKNIIFCCLNASHVNYFWNFNILKLHLEFFDYYFTWVHGQIVKLHKVSCQSQENSQT